MKAGKATFLPTSTKSKLLPREPISPFQNIPAHINTPRGSIKSSEKHALNPQELTKAQLNLLHAVHIKKKKNGHTCYFLIYIC